MNEFISIKEAKKNRRINIKMIKKLAYFELKAMNLKKYEILTELINPIIYLICFGVCVGSTMENGIVYNGNSIPYIKYVVPGILCMFSVDFFTHALFRTVIDKQWGLLGYKLMHGASPLTYIISLSLPAYIKYCIKCFLIIIISTMFFSFSCDIRGVILFILLSYVVILFWSTAGILCGIIVKNYQQRDLLTTIIITPVTFSAPVFYSIDAIPIIIKIIVQINPLTHIVLCCRKLLLLDFEGIYFPLIFIIAFCVATLFICINKIKSAELNTIRF